MLKQISLIAIAIGIATVLILGTTNVSAALRSLAPQPLIKAGQDTICGVLCASNGHGDSINLQQQRVSPYA
jgi:hypothetical protein